jgi:hypothetical protein
MSSEGLERRYRTLLRVLPKHYRAVREEELLSVLMEGAAEGRRWPEIREVLSLAWLGMRVRTGTAAKGEVESTRFGEVSRLVAVAGAALLAFVGGLQLAMFARNLFEVPGTYWDWTHPYAVGFGDDPHQLSILNYEVPACWFLVLVLLAVGWWRVARVLALAVFVGSAYLTFAPAATLFVGSSGMAVQEETVLAAVVTAALFPVRGARVRSAAVLGFASAAAVAGMAWYVYKEPLGRYFVQDRAFWALQGHGYTDKRHAMVIVAAVVLVVAVVAYRSVVWPVALAVVTVATLGPAMMLGQRPPAVPDYDLVPLLTLTCGLVVVAGAAVLKDRRSGNPTLAS